MTSRRESGSDVFAASASGRESYTTKHTFIAWALSEGANLKGLAGWLRHVTASKFRSRRDTYGRRPSVRSRADRVYQISRPARLWRS